MPPRIVLNELPNLFPGIDLGPGQDLLLDLLLPAGVLDDVAIEVRVLLPGISVVAQALV